MSALDQRTNEMLRKNAENAAAQAKRTAQLATGGSIQADTLEHTWRTIVGGIEETQRLQESARRQRQDDQQKLERIQREYRAWFGAVSAQPPLLPRS